MFCAPVQEKDSLVLSKGQKITGTLEMLILWLYVFTKHSDKYVNVITSKSLNSQNALYWFAHKSSKSHQPRSFGMHVGFIAEF